MFGKRAMRTFEIEREEMTRGWVILHNDLFIGFQQNCQEKKTEVHIICSIHQS
jgi:hypothetical protein